MAFQTFDYKVNSFFNFRVSGEASEAETNGGVGLGGVRPRARRTCEGSGIPEVQAEPVEAARWGWRAPKISCATKPSNRKLALPGCRRSSVGPFIDIG